MGRNLGKLLQEVVAVTGVPRCRKGLWLCASILSCRSKVGVGGFSQGGHMALHWVYGQGEQVGLH